MDAPTAQPPPVEKFLDVPYQQRWERHKNTIVKLFLDDGLTIPKVAERMKTVYSFDGQYVAVSKELRPMSLPEYLSSQLPSAVAIWLRNKPNVQAKMSQIVICLTLGSMIVTVSVITVIQTKRTAEVNN